MNKKCKSLDDAMNHVEFWNALPFGNRPSSFSHDLNGNVTYDYIKSDGDLTTDDVNKVLSVANDVIWNRPPIAELNIEKYFAYLLDKRPAFSWDVVFQIIRGYKFKPCLAHGDFTLDNMISANGTIYFIDPAATHGLTCKENDEAKLLESFTKFPYEYRGYDLPRTDWRSQEWVRPVHLAIAVTHMIRIQHQKHVHARAKRFALHYAHLFLETLYE